MHIIVKRVRRDGKHPVKYIFEGSPNAFGGRYPAKYFNKLKTTDVVIADIASMSSTDLLTDNSGMNLVTHRRGDIKAIADNSSRGT